MWCHKFAYCHIEQIIERNHSWILHYTAYFSYFIHDNVMQCNEILLRRPLCWLSCATNIYFFFHAIWKFHLWHSEGQFIKIIHLIIYCICQNTKKLFYYSRFAKVLEWIRAAQYKFRFRFALLISLWIDKLLLFSVKKNISIQFGARYVWCMIEQMINY